MINGLFLRVIVRRLARFHLIDKLGIADNSLYIRFDVLPCWDMPILYIMEMSEYEKPRAWNVLASVPFKFTCQRFKCIQFFRPESKKFRKTIIEVVRIARRQSTGQVEPVPQKIQCAHKRLPPDSACPMSMHRRETIGVPPLSHRIRATRACHAHRRSACHRTVRRRTRIRPYDGHVNGVSYAKPACNSAFTQTAPDVNAPSVPCKALRSSSPARRFLPFVPKAFCSVPRGAS